MNATATIAAPNLPHTKEVIKAAVERSFRDPAYFLRFFLPHWFPSALPPFHLGLLAILTGKVAFLDDYPEAHQFLLEEFKYDPDPANPDAKPLPSFVADADGQICLVQPEDNHNWIIPRGFSKTTLVKGSDLYMLVIDKTTFTVLISSSATHSETQLLDIKTELETNELLRAGFGNQVPTRADPEKWSGKELHLLNGAIIVARGRGGQVRGLTHQGKRPNRVVMDDIEDEESVATDKQREKTLNWFYSSVAPAGQLMEGAEGQDWAQEKLKIVNLGTLLGPRCLVVSLASDSTFSTVRFGARIRPGLMLWPFKLTEATYNKMRARHKRLGKLSLFSQEYDSQIRVDEDSIFPAIFHYMPATRNDFIALAQVMDPAISEESDADEAAIVVAGRHNSGHLWFFDEWGGTGKSPSEKIDKFFEFHMRWKTNLNGIEAVAYQAALLHLCREEMIKRGLFFEVTPIRHGSKNSKENRIVGTLSPRYKNGVIHHYKPLPKLESNLIDWPNGLKDFADAGAMALNLLGESVGVFGGGLEDLPPLENTPPPIAPLPRVGNYYLVGKGRLSPSRNPRYG